MGTTCYVAAAAAASRGQKVILLFRSPRPLQAAAVRTISPNFLVVVAVKEPVANFEVATGGFEDRLRQHVHRYVRQSRDEHPKTGPARR